LGGGGERQDRPARSAVAALPAHGRSELDGDRDRARGPLRSGNPPPPGADGGIAGAHPVAALSLRHRREERDRPQREPLLAVSPRARASLRAPDPLGLESRRYAALSRPARALPVRVIRAPAQGGAGIVAGVP